MHHLIKAIIIRNLIRLFNTLQQTTSNRIETIAKTQIYLKS